jgi:acid phosphatase
MAPVTSTAKSLFFARMPMRRAIARLALAAVLAMTAFAGGALADPLASACTKTYAPQTLDVTQPINLGELKNALYFYACSGAYDSDMSKVTADAAAYVAARAAQVAKPAMVLDIDETSLTNLPQMLADDFGYIPDGTCDRLPNGPCGFTDWTTKHLAKAIEQTLALYKTAKGHGVAVFFITGRYLAADKEQNPEEDAYYKHTAENLTKAGYAKWEGLVLRKPSSKNLSVATYKSGERAKIAAKYTIIVNAGDQQSDLDGGYAERAYKLPNPFYYLP